MDSRHKKITDLYKHSSSLVLGTREVMSRLIGTLVLNMEQAKSAHAQRRLDTMMEFNKKSFRILAAIRMSLRDNRIDKNEKAALELVDYLQLFYRVIFIRLANVLQAKDTQAEFDYLLARLRSQYQAWSGPGKEETFDNGTHTRPKDAPSMVIPPQTAETAKAKAKTASQNFYA